MARRDEGPYWAYSTEEQRSPRGMHRRSNAAGLSPRAVRCGCRREEGVSDEWPFARAGGRRCLGAGREHGPRAVRGLVPAGFPGGLGGAAYRVGRSRHRGRLEQLHRDAARAPGGAGRQGVPDRRRSGGHRAARRRRQRPRQRAQRRAHRAAAGGRQRRRLQRLLAGPRDHRRPDAAHLAGHRPAERAPARPHARARGARRVAGAAAT